MNLLQLSYYYDGLRFIFLFFTDKDGKVSWEEFKKHHFTHEKGDDITGDKEQMEDDEAKFKHADVDGDGGLNLEEYITFYHPGVRSYKV